MIPYTQLMTDSDRLAEQLSVANLEVTCDARVVTAGPIGDLTAYGAFAAECGGCQWLAMGGSSTGHSEAIRIVSGSNTCMHPAGWPNNRGVDVGGDLAAYLRTCVKGSWNRQLEERDDQARRYGHSEYGNGY